MAATLQLTKYFAGHIHGPIWRGIHEIETLFRIGELIEIVPVGFLGEQFLQVGGGGDSVGRYGRMAPVIPDSLHFERTYPCSHHGGEGQSQELGEIGLTDACITAGHLIQTCVRANLTVDKGLHEQSPGYSMLQATGRAQALIFQIQTQSAVERWNKPQ